MYTPVSVWKPRQHKFVRKTCIRGLLVAIYGTNPYVKGSCQVTKSSEVWGSGGGVALWGERWGENWGLWESGSVWSKSQYSLQKARSRLGDSHNWQWPWCLRKWKSETQKVGGGAWESESPHLGFWPNLCGSRGAGISFPLKISKRMKSFSFSVAILRVSHPPGDGFALTWT